MSSSQVNLEECRIPLKEIMRATQNFSSHNWVGDGGFGSVYRGQLSERWKNHLVAIKRLDRNSYQGSIEFTKEVNLVSSFNHPNIIQFVGYCDDANEKIIVFKYASNSSLDRHLGDPEKRRILTWEQRLKICLGAARGVKYLHSGVEEHNRIIHRDFKSANILLDDNLEAKICDFGLSLLSPRNQGDTHVRTIKDCCGMMAYHATRFEDTKELYLIDLVRSYYDDHGLIDGLQKLIDPTIRAQIDMSSFEKFNEIAHDCINLDVRKRPTVDRIIKTIAEALNIQSFQLDIESGKKCYMLGAKELSIRWKDDPQLWEWEHAPESRFPEVCILKELYWLSIHGKIASVMLSPNSTYNADACRAASLSKGFNSAAESNAVWQEFLPQDYREIISRRMFFPLSLGSKKRLYLLLSNSHILLHPGNLSFQLDKESGKKCYMLGAKELSITWQHDTQYWEWTHIPESRFPEVCILKQVCWLSIHGRIVAGMLSQNSTYDAYLVFRTTEDSIGLSVPAKTRLSFGGSKMETENVYLQRPHHVQENYVFPHKRKDGWMEIKLGEFDYNEGDNGKVEMAYEEIKLGHWKKGLIVEGIELRPK
ncbi:unnamed protein product [Lactuca saligna]|uniref:non-specific serine/threonine protein kinase n=1 Tax=Lactuca saligna TaxID=75948 RepID=A0AA35YEN9_LACSI|nr:unnamed protein product [Lactuca saligna]